MPSCQREMRLWRQADGTRWPNPELGFANVAGVIEFSLMRRCGQGWGRAYLSVSSILRCRESASDDVSNQAQAMCAP